MDFKRTEQYYIDAKQKYEKRHDQIEFEKWEKRVKDAAGNYNRNPHDPNTVYPKVEYNNLIRVMAKDGNEYLLTRSMHIGVNAYGDELPPQSVVDPEFYIETKWNYTRKPDPQDRNNLITTPASVLSQTKRYKLPFTPEKADEFYEKRRSEGCSLTVVDERRDSPPTDVPSIEAFKHRSIDELMYRPVPTNEQQPRANRAR